MQRSNKMDVNYLLNPDAANGNHLTQRHHQQYHNQLPPPHPHALHQQQALQHSQSHSIFKCPQCDLSYSLRGNLNKHIKSKHRNERPHLCKLCTAKFAFSDGLRRHYQLVHSGKRPFGCNLCNATFKQRSHLAKHTNSVHTIPQYHQ